MTRLKSLIILSIFVLLYATYYWIVPLAVNIPSRMPLIQNFVKKEFGAEIEIKNPKLKMGLIPAVWLDASSFSVLDKTAKPLDITNPKLKIKLFPLIFGKVHLTYFSCDKINADLKIDKNNRLYIGNYLVMKTSNPKFSLEDSKMYIENYFINLKDETASAHKKINIKGDYFNLEKYNSKSQVKFAANSLLKINEHTSTINADVNFKLPIEKSFDTNEIVFDGTITNLNLADLSPYIKRFSKNKIRQTSGVLNVRADTKALNRRTTQIASQMAIDNLSIVGKDRPSSIYFKDKLSIETICNVSKNLLVIKKLQIGSGRINSTISGKINKVSSKNPDLDLAILINKSRIEDIISLLPDTNSKDIDLNLVALKKYGYYSDLQGKLFVKGKSKNPNLKGKFVATNGYLTKPLPSDVPKITILIELLGEKAKLDVTVPVTRSEKVFIKGDIDIYNDKKTVMDITSTQNVDLETTLSILNPSHEVFNFEIGPLPFMALKGLGNIKLNIRGNKQAPHLFGAFNFKNATASFDGVDMLLKNGDGSLYFEDTDTHFITRKATLDGKPVKIDGHCSMFGILDYNITANGQNIEFLYKILNNSPFLADIKKTIPPVKNIGGKLDLAVNLAGKVKNINDFEFGKTVLLSGNIKLLGNSILLKNLPVPIKNIFGNIKFKNNDADFDLYAVFDKSKLNIKGNVKNKILTLKTKLDDVAFRYADIPVKIFSGYAELSNDRLTLYKINATADSMPILLDGTISDIFKTPNFNIYINSKPTQKFIEKHINKNATYPLKIKGDIIYTARVHGTKDLFSAKTEINLQEDSNIYYMGSTLGDTNNPIRIFLDTTISKNSTQSLTKNSIFVNNFQYDKLISSQNNKEFISQQLNAKGQILFDQKNIILHNFRVKTQNPTDAKIFNMLFKKAMIKQGLFTSNIVLNDSISAPKLLGNLNFTGIDIPLLDTTIKDVSLDFKENDIDIKSRGEIFSNKIIFLSNMTNKLTPPFVFNNMDIYLGNLDVNQIVKRLNKLTMDTEMYKLSEQRQESTDFNITNLVIKNAKLKADSVFVKNIFAKNLTADFSLNENLILALDNFKFDVAEGSVNGDLKYNLLNSNSMLGLHVNKVNANTMAEALFDLPSQIFGSLTGQAELTCNGKSHKTCMDTLSGTGGFRVADGRMPKLGSMEYLLKAANLVKSGITGITINGIIDLITPLKTGQFENINGNFSIKSGLADSIQIFSKGQDLSIFLTGTYNFATLVADMEVFGRVSKKISTVLGPLGNTSLNTLFNTIPGLNLDDANNTEFIKNFNKIPGFELNDKKYRTFSAEIYGDINGENYVQSFKWVE